MSQSCPTVKIKTTSPEQGEFVVINESDFDPKQHELLEVEEPAGKLSVAALKEALAAKGIVIPDGVTKKADLQALLDTATKPVDPQT